MEIWILAALAGWCPTGWPRWRPWPLLYLRPVPPIPDPDPNPLGPSPEPWRRGPHPEPWQPLVSGMLGALGGIVAWAILGSRFGGDGGLGPVVVISFLGGCFGLSIANALGALRGRAKGSEQGQG